MPWRPEPTPSSRRRPSAPRASLPPPLPSATTWQQSLSPAATRSRSAPWLLGLLGAAVGVVGGASLRHTPRWQLESLPREAAVFWNDTKVCEKTPCHVQWQPDDIGTTGTLRFVRTGFDDVVTGRRIGRFNKSVAVTLEASDARSFNDTTAPTPPR